MEYNYETSQLAKSYQAMCRKKKEKKKKKKKDYFGFRIISPCLITKTCLYNIDPYKPHLCIVNLGFTGVYIIFLIPAQKHRLWVLVRTASPRQF